MKFVNISTQCYVCLNIKIDKLNLSKKIDKWDFFVGFFLIKKEHFW